VRITLGGFETTEFLVNGLVPDANGRSLGFRRVGGENGLDLNFFESGNDFLLGESGVGKAFDDGGPEPFDGFSAVGSPAGAAEFPGDAFFDNIEEFEADGKELGAFTLGARRDGLREGFSFLPGDERAEISVERKGIGEHCGCFGEAFVEFAESLREISVVLDIVRHSGGECSDLTMLASIGLSQSDFIC